MRAGIQRGLCESNAVCVALAPDVFDLDEDGIAVTIVDELDEAQVDSVESAIPSCPRAAVFLRKDESDA
ncbi:ferredoxin [Nocardia alni]|uniref:ferredoxin n=1 Tax=Nocardia alni TaxID=2815723 RepID=UPI001C23405F|nr:ferredoxin [Nocardia alni]